MAKKITDLQNYTTPQNNDVMPIVDVGNNATKKLTIGTLKTTIVGSDVGFFELLGISSPSLPNANAVRFYVTSSGTSPNKEVALKAKFEDGSEVIIASVLI